MCLSSKSQLEDFDPLTLQGTDALQVRQRDGTTVLERHMRPQEVVVSDEQGGESHSAIASSKAAGGTDMELVGRIVEISCIMLRVSVSLD